MRVAAVFVPGKNRDRLLEVTKSLARGIEAQGHQVDLIDAGRDFNSKLSVYQYIALGTEQTTFFGGRIPSRIGEFLKNAGVVGGKKTFAFVIKKPVGAGKALSRLMKVMEGEGMFIRFSDVVRSAAEAEIIGKRLQI
ncbi:MAG: hypothetical protein EA404_08900 [Spirochaetaceae bacterium]|nr:MAG: hypothetical protein EA404_08900 [Spirochaetaceae bacterium]